MARKVQMVRVVEEKPESDRSESLERAPLFAETLDEKRREELDSILVMRQAPVREGTVGTIDPDQGIEEIAKRWGGGRFKVQGRNADGKPIKGAFDTIDIAGEPKFLSRQADLEYKRQLSSLAPIGGGEERQAPVAPAQPTALDIVSILAKQADIARAESAQRDADRESSHRREMERIREEARLREEARAREDDRREKERRAEEERRRHDEDARERRERADREETRRRDQEYYASMLKMQKADGGGGGAVATLLEGVKLANELRGGDGEGGGGIAETIVNALGGIVGAAAKAKAEAPAGAVTPEQAAQASRPAVPTGRAPRRAKDDSLELSGAIGRSAIAAIKHLRDIGQDPQAVFASVFDNMQRLPAPAPAPADKPAEEDAAPLNVTSASGSASS